MKIIILAVVVIVLLVLAYFLTIGAKPKPIADQMSPAGYKKTLEDADIDKSEQINLDAMKREQEKEKNTSVFEFFAKKDDTDTNSQENEAPEDYVTENEDFMYCPDSDCFKEQFTWCTPSGVTQTYPLRPEVSYYYEILQKEGEYCKVKSYFLTHEDPEWVGPEMICLYNNHIEFQQATTDTTRCEGELYNMMRGQ